MRNKRLSKNAYNTWNDLIVITVPGSMLKRNGGFNISTSPNMLFRSSFIMGFHNVWVILLPLLSQFHQSCKLPKQRRQRKSHRSNYGHGNRIRRSYRVSPIHPPERFSHNVSEAGKKVNVSENWAEQTQPAGTIALLWQSYFCIMATQAVSSCLLGTSFLG